MAFVRKKRDSKTMTPLFVIEHLEQRMWHWCILEYKNISCIVGKKNLLLTNTNSKALEDFAEIRSASVAKAHFLNPCILDPAASKTLNPNDAVGFDAFIFGGILGDDPPRERTKDELKLVQGARRNLGKAQMSTDTAVRVTWEILNGKPLSTLKFQNGITIEIAKGEEILLPYKYRVENGHVLLAQGLVEFLRKKKGF